MPALALFIGGLGASLIAFLVDFLSYRVALTLVIIAALVTLTATFVAAMQAGIDSVVVAFPTGMMGYGLALMPSNTALCCGVIAGAHVTAWGYEQVMRYMMIKAH